MDKNMECLSIVMLLYWKKIGIKTIEMFVDIAIIGSEYDGRHYQHFPNAIFCCLRQKY